MSHHGNHGMNMGGMAMGGTLPAHHTPYSRSTNFLINFSSYFEVLRKHNFEFQATTSCPGVLRLSCAE